MTPQTHDAVTATVARVSLPLTSGTPSLRERPLMDNDQATGVAAVFKVLSSDTRLRLLHVIVRDGEVRVTDLAAQVGMSAQNVSNHLQRLVDWRILSTRRDGTSIYYRIVDPCIPQMIEFAVCMHQTPGGGCPQA